MTDTPQPAEKPKLRWYQYRLWHLFLVTLVFALWLGWICHKARQQKKAVEAIQELGGEVTYDYEYDANDNYIPDAKPPGPAWFRKLVGVDFLAEVVCVLLPFRVTDAGVEHLNGLANLKRLMLSSRKVTDTGLVHLKGLTKLEVLWLDHTQATDAGLEHLQGLVKLEYLLLKDTQVSDVGFEHLKGLTNLKMLDLDRTQVSDTGIEHLKGLTKLEVLNLRGTHVSDTGLVHLKGLTKLEELWLIDTQVTDDGVEKLQQALPNCHIIR